MSYIPRLQRRLDPSGNTPAEAKALRTDESSIAVADATISTMAGLVHLIAYSDGEVRQEFTFVYAAEIQSGELKIHHESKEASWIPVGSAVELPLAESQRRRSKDSRVSEGLADVFAIFRLLIPLALEPRISMGTADPNGI